MKRQLIWPTILVIIFFANFFVINLTYISEWGSIKSIGLGHGIAALLSYLLFSKKATEHLKTGAIRHYIYNILLPFFVPALGHLIFILFIKEASVLSNFTALKNAGFTFIVLSIFAYVDYLKAALMNILLFNFFTYTCARVLKSQESNKTRSLE